MAPPKKTQDAPTPVLSPPKPSISSFILEFTAYILTSSLHGSLSQLLLSPVYGSLNVSDYHNHMILSGLAFGSLSFLTTSHFDPRTRLSTYPYVLPFYFPVVYSFLEQYSDKLGPSRGPRLAESLTLAPYHAAAMGFLGASFAEVFGVARGSWSRYSFVLLGLVAYLAASKLEAFWMDVLPSLAVKSQYLSRVWLSLGTSAVGLAQANFAAPNLVAVLAVLPAVSHTLQRNRHLEWRGVRQLPQLEMEGYRLVDRRESVTGYISVLENNELAYRVLRCDHSLLGGEWLLTEKAVEQGITGTEPIYSVFEMLEAVRLVETAVSRPDRDSKALVIGLGIGTAPKALLAHGIDTTIVELDPVVHDFAIKYFDLPTNHTAYLEDAIGWTQSKVTQLREAGRNPAVYDYILHDVFTGGAEPLALFTDTFITNLGTLLKPDGVIAINYAGSVSAVPSKQVLNTINVVFDGRCRIFRDVPAEESDQEVADFANMVVFCLNPSGSSKHKKPIFRDPVKADFLNSVSRQHHLVPEPRNEIAFPSVANIGVVTMLTEANMGSFSDKQLKNAMKHWKVMRQVVIGKVWEAW